MSLRLVTLGLSILCGSALVAQSEASVTVCALKADPRYWDGKPIVLEAPVQGGRGDGEFLSAEGCGGSAGRVVDSATLIYLARPGTGIGRTKVNFEWDRESQLRLNKAVASLDPMTQILHVTVHGVFESDRGTDTPSSGDENSFVFAHILVRTVQDIRITPRATRPNEAELSVLQRTLAERSIILWKQITAILAGNEGAQYFESQVRGRVLPGEAIPAKGLQGRVMAIDSKSVPPTVDIAVVPDRDSDIRLRLIGSAGSLVGALRIGSLVTFSGVAVSWNRNPMRVIIDVDEDGIVMNPANPGGP